MNTENNRNQSKTYFNVYAHVLGIPPRCRKEDSKIIDIKKEVPILYTEEIKQELINKAKIELAKFKSVKRASLKFSYTTQENNSPFEITELFDSRHQTFNLLN